MPRSAKAATSALEVSGDGGTGLGNGHDEGDVAAARTPRVGEIVVQHQRGFARRGRTLERRAETPTMAWPLREAGQDAAEVLGAGNGVKLVAAFDQARCRRQVVVGAQRHDQHVGLVRPAVGCDAPCCPGRSR